MTYKHRDIVIAYMDGKQIQVKDSDGDWRNLSLFDNYSIWAQFKADNEYRIKPEPKKYRVAQMKLNAMAVNDTGTAQDIELHPLFVRWLTDWVEYEV